MIGHEFQYRGQFYVSHVWEPRELKADIISHLRQQVGIAGQEISEEYFFFERLLKEEPTTTAAGIIAFYENCQIVAVFAIDLDTKRRAVVILDPSISLTRADIVICHLIQQCLQPPVLAAVAPNINYRPLVTAANFSYFS